MTNKLKEEFYNKFKYNKPDYDEIADWWLIKIEGVINDIPDEEYLPQGYTIHEHLPVYVNGHTKNVKQQLRKKYLGK